MFLQAYQAVCTGVSVDLQGLPEASGVLGVQIGIVQHLEASIMHWGVVPIQPTAQREARYEQQQAQHTYSIPYII